MSVLLPAWNEEATLGRCLESLLAIDWPDLEIIVCAGGTDATAEVARNYQCAHPGAVTVLKQNRGEGKQIALRRCYLKSGGDVIYLTDADCVVPAETFKTLIAAVGPNGADAATGPTDPFPEQRSSPWIRHQWATARAVDRGRGLESTGLHGRNSAVRRAAIEAAGAFCDAVQTGTDYHLAKRLIEAGQTIHFLPASVQTRFDDRFQDHLAQQSRWMRNVLIHGPQLGAQAEAVSVARSIALGIILLMWPLTWRWTKLPGIVLWLLPIGWMTRVRIRQQELLEQEFELVPDDGKLPRAVLHSLADLVVWARPALDLLIARRRHRW